MELPLDYREASILTVSDMHIPYHHPDAYFFLEALLEKYEPDYVISLGDLVDFHAISFHPNDPDLLSAGAELEAIQEHAEALEALIPDMYIIGSNHGDLPLRKLLANYLPRKLLRSYNEIYGVGEGWKFVDDITITTHSKHLPDIHFAHGIRKNALQVAQQRGQRFACGHYHEDFEIRYAGNPNTLLWSMMAGCLIDPKSLAFAYNKLNLKRPILGTGVIKEGVPILEPMILNKNGRWVGELYA